MLLKEPLVRPRFVDGLKSTIDVFDKQSRYLENKFKILSLGGLGYGVLQGYGDSLSLVIEGNILVVKPGAAIDREGNLIFISNTIVVNEDVSVTSFGKNKYIYVYIRHQEIEEGLKPHVKNKELSVHTEFKNFYSVAISDYKYSEKSEWIELGRVFIDYNKANEYNQHTISAPMNPFFPRENEIDMRFVAKIDTNLIDLSEEDNEMVYGILGNFADYLNEIAFKYRLLSASTASAFTYQVREDIFSNVINPYDFYKKLKSIIEVVGRVKDENKEIVKMDFWKNITRLQEFFNLNYGEKYSRKIDFYKFDIGENSYFGDIVKHFRLAGECSRDLDLRVKKEKKESKPVHKGYVQVGRSVKKEDGNDVFITNDRTVSRKHLRVTTYKGAFFIEDLRSANGTFVNAIRIEERVKQLVKTTDTIILGGSGTKLSLNEPKIQDLLNI